MPDQWSFENLPNRGSVTHRCIVEGCDFPGELRHIPEKERRDHARAHEREREREIKRKQRASLALARRVKRT